MESMYKQHPIEAKREGILTLELGNFINKEYFRGRLQQEYIDNKCL